MFKKIISIVLCVVLLAGTVATPASAGVGDNTMYEAESNNSMTTADRIYNDYTVSGQVSGYDMDYFKFTLSSRSTISMITIAEYKSCFMAGIFDSSEQCVAASSFSQYSDSGDPVYLTSVTLSAGTYYYIVFNKDGSSLKNIYTFYFEYSSSSSHTHYYSSSCDTTCNGCGEVRSVAHSYDNTCDEYCNNCGNVRSIEHKYDSPIDEICNVCDFEREISNDPVLFQEADGRWFYYINGKRSTQTTFVKYKGTWYFLKYGEWKGETAIPKHNGQFYYAENGKWDKTVNGLKKFNGIWYLIKNGKWANKTTTIYKSNGKYYYIKGGKVQSNTTGLIKVSQYDSKRTFYIKNGVVQKSVTNVVKIGSKTYYIKAGIWQNGSTGIKTIGKNQYYIKKGVLQTDATGIKKVGSATFYLKKGVVQKKNGFVKVSGKYYYLKSGKVQTGKTGLVSQNGKWYYIKKGVKDTGYNGTAKYKGVTFNVKKGNATIKGYHSCSYTEATCTAPATCIYCFDTRGSADEHAFINTNCVKCNAYIALPFTIEYNNTVTSRTGKTFRIDRVVILDVDNYNKGWAKIQITTTTTEYGNSYNSEYYDINFYDEYGILLKDNLGEGAENVGGIKIDWTYIPERTARIEIVSRD